MFRSAWKGAVQIGLITVPVKLYAAADSEKSIGLNMLHKTDLSRINMQIFCPVDGAVISRSDTVKGYEHAPGQYVVIDETDLADLPLKTTKTAEVVQFVSANDPITRFVERNYFVSPEAIGRKAFALLHQVLAAKQLAGIAKIVIRDREDLCAITTFGPTLLLSILKWPDEVRSTDGMVEGPAPEIKPAERKMAEQLVAAMTAPFDPAEYQDEYRAALMTIIDRKVSGAPAPAGAPAAPAAPQIDLMAALAASVAATKTTRKRRA